MDVLKEVENYYTINSITETYCFKCDKLEKNFICNNCGIINYVDNEEQNNEYVFNMINTAFEQYNNLNMRLQELLKMVKNYTEVLEEIQKKKIKM